MEGNNSLLSNRSLESNVDSTSSLIQITYYYIFYRFLQTGPDSDICNEEMHESTCIGGIARVYTASRKLLDNRPNSIFLNAGDMYQGTIWYNLFKWNVTVEFMNKLPHDVLVIITKKSFTRVLPSLLKKAV